MFGSLFRSVKSSPWNDIRCTNCLSVYFVPDGTTVSLARFWASATQWNVISIWFRAGCVSVGMFTWNTGWTPPFAPPLFYYACVSSWYPMVWESHASTQSSNASFLWSMYNKGVAIWGACSQWIFWLHCMLPNPNLLDTPLLRSLCPCPILYICEW